jgi:hypothetical protein
MNHTRDGKNLTHKFIFYVSYNTASDLYLILPLLESHFDFLHLHLCTSKIWVWMNEWKNNKHVYKQASNWQFKSMILRCT